MSDEPIAPKRRPNIIPAGGNSEGEAPRPSVDRPSIRPDDSRTEASKRAAELRQHRVDNVATDDTFDVSKLAPEGWTYQWHTWSIYEQRQTANLMASENRGWQPVPRERHPHMMPKDSTLDFILDRGNILMMLPTEIVDEYRQAELKAARDQVRWKEQQIAGTPEGTLPRDHAQARPKISKSFEAMPVPD
jgi:hypothetical protein